MPAPSGKRPPQSPGASEKVTPLPLPLTERARQVGRLDYWAGHSGKLGRWGCDHSPRTCHSGESRAKRYILATPPIRRQPSTSPMTDIDVLLQENRKFEPPPRVQGRRQRFLAGYLRQGGPRPREILGGAGARARVDQAVEQGSGVEASACAVVHRWQAEHIHELHRTAHSGTSPEQGCAHLGRGAR